MGIFVKGDVIVLPFPFSDLSTTKVRPALIISVPKVDEIIVCQITSQATRPDYAVPLVYGDFISGGLNHDSFVRPNKIFLADISLIRKSVGKINPKKLDDIIEVIIDILITK